LRTQKYRLDKEGRLQGVEREGKKTGKEIRMRWFISQPVTIINK